MGKRVTIEIPEEDFQELEQSGRAQERPVEAVCAEAARDLAAELRARREDPLFKLLERVAAEPATGEPSDASVNHDYYLYGWPKRVE